MLIGAEKPRPVGNDLAAQMDLFMAMSRLPVHDAIGACCSYLLQCSYDHPEVVRRVLNERVIREGFSGISLLTVLKRAAE